MRFAAIVSVVVLVGTGANAACEFVEGGCSRDSYGNSYRTEQNFGGGYNTYRNGILDSQTSQDINGGWTTKSRDGGTLQRYDYDPYAGRNSGY